jgi:creatinine amidohydrolase/Fe(II)-dependent formamide hydrolase-like protein
MLSRCLVEMPSRVANAYLKRGGDICLVPVGSVERVGPHLPLGSRCFVVEALAKMLAEAADGLYLPVTPYSTVGDTWKQPGSVDVPEETLVTYVRNVVDELIDNGFRRIIIMTYLDYLRYSLPCEYYEEEQIALAGIHMREGLHRFGADVPQAETSLLLAALKVLGNDALAAEVEARTQKLLAEKPAFTPVPAYVTELRRWANLAYEMGPSGFPVLPGKGASAAKGERLLKQMVKGFVPAVAALRDYNDYISRRESRGFERGGRFSFEL